MAVNDLNFNNKVVFAQGMSVGAGQPLTLPISASDPVSAVNGDMYYNSTSNVAKVYENGIWQTINTAAAGHAYFVNTFTLTPTDISNGYVTLTGTPTTASDTILNIVGGVTQQYSVDYIVPGNQLNWTGLGLSGILASGDVLVVQFD